MQLYKFSHMLVTLKSAFHFIQCNVVFLSFPFLVQFNILAYLRPWQRKHMNSKTFKLVNT